MTVLRFLAGVVVVLGHLAQPLASLAQEAGRIPRVGVLGPSASDPLVEAFKQGIEEGGSVDGKTIGFEDGDVAADLVRSKVDVLVASSQRAIAARQATTTIPIVMPIITDPVRLGLGASLARPGGNATGFATQNDELAGVAARTMERTTDVAGGGDRRTSACSRRPSVAADTGRSATWIVREP